jgi:hypothetical protein
VSNLDTILAFLRGKGLTPAQAAGVAGNLQVESGFNPAAHNDREGAIGLAQWEGGRRTALDNYAASTGGPETDLTTQLNFLWQELNTSQKGAFQKLLATSDAASAAAVFDQYYERSSGAARSTRIADAQAIASGVGAPAGSLSAATASAGSSGSSGGGDAVDAGFGGGVFGGVEKAAFDIALKVVAAGTAAALVIVGAVHTVKS